MKNFSIILLTVFIISAIVGILIFSGMIPLGSQEGKEGSGGTVVMWGTVKIASITKAIESFNKENKVYVLKYVEKNQDTLDTDLLEALASGTGPDIFFISEDLAYKYSNKILTIPYKSYPLSVFRETFSSAGEVFLTSEGFLAFPMTVDPLVLYYNRNILDTNGIIYPPLYWDQLNEFNSKLTRKDSVGKIQKSAFALGQYSNITNAKDILSMFLLQVGNPIVFEKKGSFLSSLNTQIGNYKPEEILEFYTSFTDPLNENYSWNKSLPLSRDSFIAGNLAFYFGFASELNPMIARNPNLNFNIAPVPQIKDAEVKVTSGRVIGLAISSFSKNLNSSFIVANLLATGNFAKEFAKAQNLAPARRDLLLALSNSDDAFLPTFYSSALFTRSWLDPNPKESSIIFSRMIENILSNNLTVTQSMKDASSKLNLLLMK